jgi:hypothetical protein
MCTVFGLLVADYNRSDTAQFGTYVAVRALPGLEQALGSMTAPAPLVLRFDRGRTLVDAARDTMRQLSESIDISLLPFEDLVRAVAPARLGDELPLFGMALAYDNTPAHPVAAGGMSLRPLGMRQYRTSIDLEASVSVDSVGTRIMMLYNPAKLRRAPVRDFMHRFIHMLAQAADDPALPLAAPRPWPTATRAAAGNGPGRSPSARPGKTCWNISMPWNAKRPTSRPSSKPNPLRTDHGQQPPARWRSFGGWPTA